MLLCVHHQDTLMMNPVFKDIVKWTPDVFLIKFLAIHTNIVVGKVV